MTQQQALSKTSPNVAMTRGGFAPANMDEAWRFANALARSTFIPERFRDKPDECLIALDLAGRLRANWLAVMQHCYQVHGQPGIDASMTIGLVNSSGLFEPIQYEAVGDHPRDKSYRVRAYSRRIGTEAVLYGPWIDWPLVEGEGWLSKGGSKWKTMPEQMFHYRAAAWWQRRHCPEMTLGMYTTDELYDAGDRIAVQSQEVTMPRRLEPVAPEAVEAQADPTNPTPEPDLIEPDDAQPAAPAAETPKNGNGSDPDKQAELTMLCVQIAAAGKMVTTVDDFKTMKLSDAPEDADPGELPMLICQALSSWNKGGKIIQGKSNPGELAGVPLGITLDKAKRAVSALTTA
jgi:hypothetical protein